MENLIYQITNEIKSLDAYVNAMKKVEDRKAKLEDLENLQMHINNLKAWAGMTDDARENSLHKHIVNGSKLDRINRMKELFEKGLVRFDGEAAKETERLIIGVDFGSGKDESRNHIYCR